MPIIPLVCPNCNANLTVDSGKDAAICEYCGRPYIVKDAVFQTYVSNVTNINAETVNIYSQKDFEVEAGKLIKYHGEAPDVKIPDNVRTIGSKAFEGLMITSIQIPSSVMEIGYQAFSDCAYLTSIEVPDSVASIGWGAFSGCRSLVKVKLPDKLQTIEDELFSGCTGLKEIYIPNSVTKIEYGAFYHCTNLMKVHFSEGTQLQIIEGIKDENRGLYNAQLPGAFEGCKELPEINLPDSLTVIGDCAFKGCVKFTEISFPDSLTKICYNAFDGCRSLKRIYFSDSSQIEGVWKQAFANIAPTDLSQVHFPAAMEIYPEVFDYTEPINSQIREHNQLIRKEEERRTWREAGKCQYCGGTFVSTRDSIFSSPYYKCVKCGSKKNY